MDCREFIQLQSSYLDGALSNVERLQAETHLGECLTCRRKTNELRNLTSLLTRLSWEPAPPVLERLVQHRTTRHQRWSWRRTLRDAWEDVIFNLRHMDRRLLWSKLAAFPVTFSFFLSILASFEVGRTVSYDVYPLTTDWRLSMIEQKSQAQLSERPLLEWIDSTSAIQGEDAMTVLAVVNRRGNASINNVVDYPRHRELYAAVRRNLSFTHFQPAVLNGRRVQSYLILSFFKIDVVG